MRYWVEGFVNGALKLLMLPTEITYFVKPCRQKRQLRLLVDAATALDRQFGCLGNRL